MPAAEVDNIQIRPRQDPHTGFESRKQSALANIRSSATFTAPSRSTLIDEAQREGFPGSESAPAQLKLGNRSQQLRQPPPHRTAPDQAFYSTSLQRGGGARREEETQQVRESLRRLRRAAAARLRTLRCSCAALPDRPYRGSERSPLRPRWRRHLAPERIFAFFHAVPERRGPRGRMGGQQCRWQQRSTAMMAHISGSGISGGDRRRTKLTFAK